METLSDFHEDIESVALRLVADYRESLMAEAVQLCGDRAAAEDLVFRTLEVLFRGERPSGPDHGAPLIAWLRGVMRRIHRDSQRGMARTSVVYLDPETLELVADANAETGAPGGGDGAADPAAVAQARDDAEKVREAVDSLPPRMREIIVLRYFESVPIARMAAVLRISQDAVKCRLYYARKVLAQRLRTRLGNRSVKALMVVLALAALAAIGAGIYSLAVYTMGERVSPRAEVIGAYESQGEQNMNATTRSLLAAPIAALTVAATTVSTASYGESVWKDAIIWFNGAADLNNDGMWTGNEQNSGSHVWSRSNGSSAGCELPDARHGALAYSESQLFNYQNEAADVYNTAGFQIRTNDVGMTAWGNKVVKCPCLYLPQTRVNGTTYAQNFMLFGGGRPPIAGNNWTALFRCRIDDYVEYGENSWLLRVLTTDLGGVRELRFGFKQEGWGGSATAPYYLGFCIGGNVPTLTSIPVATNEWLEISLAVNGREWRVSYGTTNSTRRYTTYWVPGNHTTYTTNFIPNSINLGGPRAKGYSNGSDNFRGDIQMFAMWDRTLSDREVLEAFGNGSPNTFRLGEEDCTLEMFGGAAPAAGETVTLDPLVFDKRLFPTTLTKGATFRIPFSIDAYSAGRARWLRFSPQEGSASGTIAVALDGNGLGSLKAYARGLGAAARSSYFYIKPENFTQGDHVLTLTRTADGTGNVIFDVIELGGGWQIGLVDGNPYEIGRAGSGTPWHLETWNFKEYDYWSARTANANTPVRLYWNLPQGAAEVFSMRMRYATCWVGNMPMTNSLVTYVNSMPVYTNSSVTWHTENHHTQVFDIPAELNAFHDGDNEISFEFSPCSRTDGDTDWVVYDMVGIEPLEPKLKKGFVIIVK